jgi:hypothetical protein
VRAKALTGAGCLAWRLGRYEQARQRCDAAIALYRCGGGGSSNDGNEQGLALALTLRAPEQKEANRVHASARVHVEHGIRRVKGFAILRDEYRLALGLFPMIAHAVVGLVQLNRIMG